MSPPDVPADTVSQPTPSSRERHARRAARWRWGIGLAIALGFHVALAALIRVQVAPQARADMIDPRIAWVGDKALLDEDTLQGQVLSIFNPAPLFLPTSQNFASTRRSSDDARRPGEIFSSYGPVLLMPYDASPPGLIAAPTDRMDPVAAVQSFRWPYLGRFGRADPVARSLSPRLARVEVRAAESGSVVLAESIPVNSAQASQDLWPDWRPFGLFVTVSESGRLSEPVMLGGGSGSDVVDQFMREQVRRRMRLDLRLGPGNYRIAIGP